MTRHRLDNDVWLFDSNCFVCEPRNAGGLRIPFHHDDEDDTVVAEFHLGAEFSGAPSYVHGGVTLAVLDEAQGWATIALGGKFAVTAETTTRFKAPVMVGKDYEVVARVTGQTERRIQTAAEVRQPDGTLCAESTATFVVLSPARARDAIGTDVADDHGSYLKGPTARD